MALVLVTSCRPRRDLSQYTQEDPKSGLVSDLKMGEAKTAGQLKAGFYQVEEGGWRWVAGKFQVELRAPFASQKLGATLTLRGNLPEILLSRTGGLELKARVNQTVLPAMRFARTGDVVYQAEVPPSALAADQILVEFVTDKALPPNTFPNDGRELALIVSSITLDTKK